MTYSALMGKNTVPELAASTESFSTKAAWLSERHENDCNYKSAQLAIVLLLAIYMFLVLVESFYWRVFIFAV